MKDQQEGDLADFKINPGNPNQKQYDGMGENREQGMVSPSSSFNTLLTSYFRESNLL